MMFSKCLKYFGYMFYLMLTASVSIYAYDTNNLFQALYDNDSDAVREILENGVSADSINAEGYTALIYAITDNTGSDIVDILLKYGANPDAKSPSSNSFVGNTTPLLASIELNNENMIESLLTNGATLDMKAGILIYDEISPVAFSMTDTVTTPTMLLILSANSVRDAEYDLRGLEGASAYLLAVDRGCTTETLQTLSDLGYVNIDTCTCALGDNTTALMLAAKHNYSQQVGYLIENGGDAKEENSNGLNSYDIARMSLSFDVLMELIDREEDSSVKSEQIQKALMCFAASGNTEACEKMTSKYGETTSINYGDMLACAALGSASDSDTFSAILSLGGDVNDTLSDDSFTPLILAAVANTTETLTMLVDYGADINATNGDGYSAIVIAATCGATDAVKFLLEKNVDVPSRDELTDECQEMIEEYPEILSVLEDNGY